MYETIQQLEKCLAAIDTAINEADTAAYYQCQSLCDQWVEIASMYCKEAERLRKVINDSFSQ